MNTTIPPDLAPCPDCREEFLSPFNRRFRYPFTHCSRCGPGFSILHHAPAIQANSGMAAFTPCPECAQEQENINDRHFHALASTCYECGPQVRLERLDGRQAELTSLTQLDAADAACTLLQQGHILLIKGMGCYHLACDASSETTVQLLRLGKQYFGKPLALMARDLDVIRRHAHCNEAEAQLLQSPQAPIVLLDKRPMPLEETANVHSFGDAGGPRAADLAPLAKNIAPGLQQIGFMLPSTPLYHLLLKRMNRPIVMTSANMTGKPPCIDDEEARQQLHEIADYVLWHEADIVNRLDDSIARIEAGKPRVLRHARGYAPASLPLPEGFAADNSVLAMGAAHHATFCLSNGGQAVVSQHMGNLHNPSVFNHYLQQLEHYHELFDFQPQAIAIDPDPNHPASQAGREQAERQRLPVLTVTHHHSHIAACLAENGWPLDGGKVLGVALNELGYGADGTLWGGEFLYTDYIDCERLGCFKPVALLDGKNGLREPWRNTYAHLMAEMGWQHLETNFKELELVGFLRKQARTSLDARLAKGEEAPQASSCGRLFEAVAAAIGICRDYVHYEDQAALELEALVDHDVLRNEDEKLAYPFAIPRLKTSSMPYIEPLAMWQALLGDLLLQTPPGVIAARFHRGLAQVIVQMIRRLSVQDGEYLTRTIALSGDVFQNQVLLEQVEQRLLALGYQVLTHQRIPTNDSGLSLGQAVIALAQLQHNREAGHVSGNTR